MNKDTEFQGYLKNYVGFTFDIEADGFVFQSTKLWTIHFKDIQTQKSFKFNPFKMQKVAAKKKFLAVVDTYVKRGEVPKIIAHNGLGYDIFALCKHLDIDFEVGKNGKDTLEGREVEFIDTFYLSMFLWPDRPRHGVEYFGTVMDFPKIDYREALIEAGALDKNAPKGAEFKFYHPLMETYCERDTDVGMMIFEYLLNQMYSLYGKCILGNTFFKKGNKSFFLMSCQDYSGFKFDVEFGKELEKRIEGMMLEIEQIVEPQLPPRELGKTEAKGYTFPAKPWKQNGEFSSHMNNFLTKHNCQVFDDHHVIKDGVKYKITPGEPMPIKVPMEMKNQDQMKDWFISLGWEPTFYNFKRGPDGKPMRDPLTRQLIKTTPKLQDQGTICPNLLELDGELPKLVVKWMSLRNRLGTLQGWLANERLLYDGRIGASRTGIAATHRQKHSVVVNVPKASEKVLLGTEFRSLWISEPNGKIAAGDAAAIEGRVQGHYCYRFDGGVTAEELLKGDVHSKNAKAFYGHLPEVAAIDIHAATFDKDDPGWKPYRDRSKNG